jgi:hypothetical protein
MGRARDWCFYFMVFIYLLDHKWTFLADNPRSAGSWENGKPESVEFQSQES